MKAESRLHFAPANSRNAQGAAIKILDYPLSLKRDFQKSRAEGPADMRPSFAPVKACVGEATAQRPSYLEVDAKSLTRLRSI